MNWILGIWLASCGADAASTHVALQSHTGHELILTQNPYMDDGLIAGQAALGYWAFRRLHQTHPRLAYGLAIVASSLRVTAAVHNLGQLR